MDTSNYIAQYNDALDVKQFTDKIRTLTWDSDNNRYWRDWTKLSRTSPIITNKIDAFLFTLIQNECGKHNDTLGYLVVDLHCKSYLVFYSPFFNNKDLELHERKYHFVAMYESPN